MPRRRDSPTFQDIVNEPTWSDRQVDSRGEHAVRPGSFNVAGEFFDPSGTRLTRVGKVTPGEARDLVEGGAWVAFEECGCGGWNGCSPGWLTSDALAALRGAGKPRFVKGHGSPTWIDVWEGDDVSVVFAHGDAEWGEALG